MSNSHVLVRSLVHIQGGAKCICIACSGQMRDLNPFHILVQAKSACSHMPTLSRICPAFLQASTRQPLARMQEIVGRTNVMAIRFSLSAFTSPNNASFVHRMPQTFSQPTKVLLWKSSWPCGDLERVQFSDCLESKPFACPRAIGQNGAFALTTARFWRIMQGQAFAFQTVRRSSHSVRQGKGVWSRCQWKRASEKFETSMPVLYGSLQGASFRLQVWFTRNYAPSHWLCAVAAAWELKMCPTFRKEIRCLIIKPIHSNVQRSTQLLVQKLRWAMCRMLSSCQKINCLDGERLCHIKYDSFFLCSQLQGHFKEFVTGWMLTASLPAIRNLTVTASCR